MRGWLTSKGQSLGAGSKQSGGGRHRRGSPRRARYLRPSSPAPRSREGEFQNAPPVALDSAQHRREASGAEATGRHELQRSGETSGDRDAVGGLAPRVTRVLSWELPPPLYPRPRPVRCCSAEPGSEDSRPRGRAKLAGLKVTSPAWVPRLIRTGGHVQTAVTQEWGGDVASQGRALGLGEVTAQGHTEQSQASWAPIPGCPRRLARRTA